MRLIEDSNSAQFSRSVTRSFFRETLLKMSPSQKRRSVLDLEVSGFQWTMRPSSSSWSTFDQEQVFVPRKSWVKRMLFIISKISGEGRWWMSENKSASRNALSQTALWFWYGCVRNCGWISNSIFFLSFFYVPIFFSFFMKLGKVIYEIVDFVHYLVRTLFDNFGT